MTNFKQLIRTGAKQLDQKARAIHYISNLKVTEGNEYEVTVKPYKKSKTDEQRGYYFSTVVPVACAWQGLTAKQGHMFLKEECLAPVFFSTLTRDSYQYKPSIKEMKIDTMAKYIDDCINFLGSHGQAVDPPRYQE